MPRTASSNDYERALLEIIASHGWQCTSVGAGEDQPCFSYTIGLLRSFNYSELMVIGLAPTTAHGMFTTAANAARAGRPLALEQPSEGLVEGYPCVFVKVPEIAYGEYVLSASWFYEGNAFPLYQIVWPSKEGRFPWHPSAGAQFRAEQPVVGLPSGGA